MEASTSQQHEPSGASAVNYTPTYGPRNYQVPEIQDLFQAVKDATTSSKKADYVSLEDSHTLFPDDAIRQWRRGKTNIKRVLETHESALDAMQKSQKKCWSYRSKAKTYHVMLDTALAVLAYCEPDTAEYRARGAAIRDLERDITRRRGTLAKYVLEYEGNVLRELTIRGRIHRTDGIYVAIALESDIRAQTRDVIVDNIPADKCTSSLNPSEICRRLYDVTSRKYTYTAPPPNVSDADFNTPVVPPHIYSSALQTLRSPNVCHPALAITADVDLSTPSGELPPMTPMLS